MSYMFAGTLNDNESNYRHSSFNQDISNWRVSAVTDMNNMFAFSNFNGPLGRWDVSSVTDMSSLFTGSTENGISLSISNYDNLLIGWSNQSLQQNVKLGMGLIQCSPNAENARSRLINLYNWDISDGGFQ